MAQDLRGPRLGVYPEHLELGQKKLVARLRGCVNAGGAANVVERFRGLQDPMPREVLHAHWAGQPAAWHAAAEPRRMPWVETSVLTMGVTIGPWHLYHYRLKQQLTLLEMVGLLDSCVDADTLRRIELGQMPVPNELAAWLAG